MLQFREDCRHIIRVGDVLARFIEDDIGGDAAKAEFPDNLALLVGEYGVGHAVLFAERFYFDKRVRNALLQGERKNLNIVGLELLPDLFL